VQVECNTLLESSQGELQVFFRPCPNRRSKREVMNAQSPGSPNRDSFGTPKVESREKMPFGCKCDRETHRILYGGRWWLPLGSGRGESSESRVVHGLFQHQECSKCELTNLWVSFECRTEQLNKLVPLPSLIPELSAHPSYPPFSAGSWERHQVPTTSVR